MGCYRVGVISQIPRVLYGLARMSNGIRIAGRLSRGNPRPFLRHVRNRAYFRAFGRFLG